jgi:hypothetical protein
VKAEVVSSLVCIHQLLLLLPTGLNGLIWVSPHIPRGEDDAPLQHPQTAADQQQQQQQQQQQPSTAAAAAGGNPAAIAAAAAAAGGPSKQQREAVVRVAGAIRALAALMLQVYPDCIVEAYTVSVNLVASRNVSA